MKKFISLFKFVLAIAAFAIYYALFLNESHDLLNTVIVVFIIMGVIWLPWERIFKGHG